VGLRGARVLAVVPVVLAGLLIGAAGTAVAAKNGPRHPDTDFMGSTVQAHETVSARGMTAQTVAPGSATGFDVSHYQGTVDWASAKTNGASFAYMKATEGTDYTDPQFTTNYGGSANAGLARGAYHFALPSDSSGAAQATFFLAHGGGWVADGHTLPPVLDIEYNPYGTADWAGWCYNLSPDQIAAWITDFTTTIHDRTNRWPAIYTTNGWWTNCTGSNTGFGNDPLWIAPSNSDVSGSPVIPASWTAYTFYQYANSGTFPGDQDYFNGTPDQVPAFSVGDGQDQIQAHYTALGANTSSLGDPVGGEYPIAGGWAQDYQNGTIYYAPNTGAYAVTGPILTRYQQLGGPGGSLGFPTSDTTTTPDGNGQSTTFGDASLYYSSANGTHLIQGAIRAKWLALGGTQTLGFPTTDESTTPDGIGRYNHFSLPAGASIYWTPNTGAHSIQGPIRDKWASLGWENGLGYPTTDESTTPDGIGRYNHFSLSAGASIYWTPNTGAHSIQGAIRDKWASLGWETGPLAYPTSDEYNVTGGRRNNFQHGYITWYSANGATQVTYN
jgi:GH25 family lysozyme M1 (1,4-beta-N-acetylmuramidase)